MIGQGTHLGDICGEQYDKNTYCYTKYADDPSRLIGFCDRKQDPATTRRAHEPNLSPGCPPTATWQCLSRGQLCVRRLSLHRPAILQGDIAITLPKNNENRVRAMNFSYSLTLFTKILKVGYFSV